MARKRTDDRLRRNDTVVAAEDLVGVPAGTRGRVILVDGFAWIRYRVEFTNGMDIGSLDRSQLLTLDEWKQQQRQAVAP